MRSAPAVAYLILSTVVAGHAVADILPQRYLLRFDTDGDFRLSRAELESYFKEKKSSNPADAADDVLSALPGRRDGTCQQL